MQRSGATLLAAVLAKLPKFGIGGRHLQSGSGHPVRPGQQQVDRALARRHAAPGGVDTCAGPHAEHLRQRELSRRDCCRNRCRSVRDPHSPSRPITRGLELLERLRTLAQWEPRGSRPRDDGKFARGRGVSYAKYELVRTYVGIVADVTVDWSRRPDQGRSRLRRSRLRPDHQPRRAAQSDRRQCRPDGQPNAGREADLQPQCGHQPQLGQLPDPDFSECARRSLSI